MTANSTTANSTTERHAMRATTRTVASMLCVLLAVALQLAPVATAGASVPDATPTRPHVSLTLPASPGPLPASPACTGNAPVTCELWATTGTITLPGLGTIVVWGYGLTAGAATVPGPALIVTQGNDVHIIVHNDLPPATGPTSLSAHGQDLPPDTTGIATGTNNSATPYQFIANKPGTFLYEAGLTPDGPRQVALGLSGALIVRPTGTPNQAYSDLSPTPASAFDDEALVILSEIDPALNANPLGFDLSKFKPTYRLINGNAYPNTDPIPTDVGRKVLLRYLNAGLENHSIGLLGRHQTIVGNHGRRQQHPYTVVAETIAAGTTLDTIVTMPTTAPPWTLYPLYEPANHLDNAGATTLGTTNFGGMLTSLQIVGGGVGTDTVGPTTAGVQVAPNPSNGTGTVTLTANTDDTFTGGSNVVAAEWFVDGGDLGAGFNNPMSGAWATPTEAVTASVPVGLLPDGTRTLSVRAKDSPGNWGGVASTTLVIDRAGPVTSSLRVTPNPTNGSVVVAVTATGDDTGAGGSNVVEANFFLDSSTCSGAANPLTLSGPVAPAVALIGTISAPIVAGTHDVSAQSRDAAGNWGPCASTQLVVDQTPPSVSGVAAAPNPTNAPSVTLTASATDLLLGGSDIVGAEWSEGASAVPAGTGTAIAAADSAFDSPTEALTATVSTTGFAVGNHTLWVRARDAAGNWSNPVSTTLNVLTLFADSFGSGDFSAWNGGSNGPGLSVTAAASLSGLPAFGMQATLGGSTTARYVQDNTPANETTYHGSFSFNPNGATTAGTQHDIFVGRNTAGTTIFRVQYRRQTGPTKYQVRALVRRAGGERATSWFTITNANHVIEVAWASGASAEFRLSIDGTQRQKFINLNTSAYLLDSARLGPAAGLRTAMSGTEYFDGFGSRR